MRGITKSFFGVPVLDAVDLDVMAGEVHAVVGENGAGKSTLMKILAGAYQPDAGSILLDGEEVRFGHPRQAQERGVSIIYQEFNLLPERTVAQNIFLGREPRGDRSSTTGRWRRPPPIAGRARRRGCDFAATTGARALRRAAANGRDRQGALVRRPGSWSWTSRPPRFHRTRSTPSSSVVRRLQRARLAVVYISHRLEEIFESSRRITVLKDGRKVDTVASDSVRPGELVRMMVGRELDHYFPPRASRRRDRPVRDLQVRGGTVGKLHDIDLEVRAGEIVGLGRSGRGGTDRGGAALFGVEPFTAAIVELNGKPVHIRSPRQAIRAGIGFLTEDRKLEGLVLPQSVRDNALLALRSLARLRMRERPVKRGAIGP